MIGAKADDRNLVRARIRYFGTGQRPFDVPCQSDIRNKLKSIIADREYKRIVDDLKQKATIVVYQ